MKKYRYAKVISCQPERKKGDIFHLTLDLGEGEKFPAGHGPIVAIKPEEGYYFPRPFTLVSVEGNIISLLIKAVGPNTKTYSRLGPGEIVQVFGPQGSPIPYDENAEYFILVGGGIGAAALIMLAKELVAKGKHVIVILGGKDESQLCGLDFFASLSIPTISITENGEGYRGLATEPLEKILRNSLKKCQVIACGPGPMLEAVHKLCVRYSNSCVVICEELMACGMGACKGCAIFCTDGKVRHICSDGPAFPSELIDWPKFMPMPVITSSETRAAPTATSKVNFKCKLGPLELESPVMNSSGCLAVDALEDGSYDFSALGALVTKGVSVEPRQGNPMPRVCEVPSGMINAIGVENVGIEAFLGDELPRYLALGKPVIVNIFGNTIEEYAELSSRLDGSGAAALEINVSCPNVKAGGMIFGTDPAMTGRVVSAVRRKTSLPLITKLTPNVTNIVEIAKAALGEGSDIISLINTVAAMAIDVRTRRVKIANIFGGQSGPSIRPRAVQLIFQIFMARLKTTIIGMGGIDGADAGAELMMAGANAIAVGTGGFSDRSIGSNILAGLEEIIICQGFGSSEELTGSALVPTAGGMIMAKELLRSR